MQVEISKSWQVGDILLDLYQIIETLGDNSVATVYKVRHLGWNIDLMLQIPEEKILQSIGGTENFEAQIKHWVDLAMHPNLMTCYYVRSVQNTCLVFTEYIDGGSLHDAIREGRLYQNPSNQTLQRILDIAIQSAWGLHVLHEQGIVHEDIRPANILLSSDGLAKVTNLGMSHGGMRVASFDRAGVVELDLTGNGAMSGAYCSPEQAKLQPLTPNTDTWSWGLMLLEMFQGQRTWSVGTSAGSALKHYQDNQDRIVGWPELPPMPGEVSWLLRRCFRKNRSDRPSMLEMASDLAKIYNSLIGVSYPRKQPESQKETPGSLNNQGLSFIDLSLTEMSLKLWDRALEIQPNHVESTYNRSLTLWRTGRINDKALVKNLENLPNSSTGAELRDYLLSLIHLERDDCDRALELLERLPPQSPYRSSIQAAQKIAEARSPMAMGLIRTFEDHTNLVKSICFSADGRSVLSGGELNTLKLWSVETGECLQIFRGHAEEVKCVGISGDSKYAISASWDKTLKLWDVDQGTCLRSFQPHENEIFTICLSIDGTVAGSGSDDGFNLWQVHTGECLGRFQGHNGDILSLALSRDGKYVLSGSLDNTVKLWDALEGNCLQTFLGHSSAVTCVYLSADSQIALSGSSDHTLKVWELSTGICIHTLSGHTSEVTSVCLDAQNAYALSGSSDHTLKLWELSTGRCLRTFEGHSSAVTSVCLSPDGVYALSGSMDDTLKLWSVKTATPPYEAPMRLCPAVETRNFASLQLNFPETAYNSDMPTLTALIHQRNYVAAAAHARLLRGSDSQKSSIGRISRNGKYFSAWRQLYVCLPRKAFIDPGESVNLPRLAKHDPSDISAVALSQDARYALSADNLDNTVKLWALGSGRTLRTFEGHTDMVRSVCLSANGQNALSGSADKTVKLWGVATGLCMLTLSGHQDGVTSVCFSPDGDNVFSGSSDRTIKCWQISTGECLYSLTGHQGSVTSVCASPDGRYLLSGSTDRTLKMWDLMQQKCLHVFQGHHGSVTSVSMSADGVYAISGSADKTLKFWQLNDPKCLQTLMGHTDEVSSVCLTLDGRYALSGSRDQTVKIWQVHLRQCLHTFTEMTGPVNAVTLSADGSYALCGSDGGALKLWPLDWELGDRQTVPWDEGARTYLEVFLTLHKPTATPRDGERNQPPDLTPSRNIPFWTDEDFKQLLYTLGCTGYGWLETEGVRTQLETMAANWQWLSLSISQVPEDLEEAGTQLPHFPAPEKPENVPEPIADPGKTNDGEDTSLDLPSSQVESNIEKAKVTLKVESGVLKGRKFEFDGRATCVIGRGKDCHLDMPNDRDHQTISRYHCLLDINPPAIRVRDLSSKNGTIVNNSTLGKIAKKTTEVESDKKTIAEIESDLHAGDRIKIGYTVFRVEIQPSPPNTGHRLSEPFGGLEPGDPNTGVEKLPTIKGYTPLKLLGQGRVSQVYSIRHDRTGEVLALKVMRPHMAPTQDAIARFQRDLENLKALNHPNIVKIFDYGYWDDRFFLTLEYCNSSTVAKVMQQEGKCLSIDESLAIIFQLLNCFEYAHELEVPYGQQSTVIESLKGLVHGNLNPGNIFFWERQSENAPQIKVGDYGLSKALDLLGFSGQTMTGNKPCRPVFMSRQQALDIQYIQTDLDIWSAAASLYFMLTGRFAREFTGKDPWIVVFQTQPVPIRIRNPSVPKALAELIDLALVDKPHIHFKKAGAFKRALETVI